MIALIEQDCVPFLRFGRPPPSDLGCVLLLDSGFCPVVGLLGRSIWGEIDGALSEFPWLSLHLVV